MQGLELRLQESEVDSQRVLEHQDESNRHLRQQLDELQKRLKDKENKLIEATEIIRVLRNEVQTLQQQLERQRRNCQEIIRQSGKTCQCVRQVDEVTSMGYVSPPNLLLSCTTEDDPAADRPFSLGDAAVTSPQQEPMCVVKVKLEDCCDMLGPSGVYKVPTEDGDHGDEDRCDDDGSCGYDQHDDDNGGDGDDDDDDDDGSWDEDSNEGDSDYDPTNDLKTHQRSHGEKTPPSPSLSEPQGQRQRKSHECSECGEVFPSLHRLLVHQKTRCTGKTMEGESGQVKSHDCNECGKSFLSQSRLSIHQRVHAKTKPFTETDVETEMTDGNSASGHRQGECDEIPEDPCAETLSKAQKAFECDECGKCFTTQSYLKLHKKLHTGEKSHVCTQCDKGFVSSQQLRLHLRQKHKQEMPYQCRHCPENFTTLTLLKIHRETHLKFTKGGKKFRSKNEAPHHMRAHARKERRQGKCDEMHKDPCAESVKKGQRTAECFSHLEEDDGITKESHQECQERIHQCDKCGKIVKTASNLISHKRLHTGEKPHICDKCGKAFATRGNMQDHYRIHTQEKPYVCPLCPKRFLRARGLKLHKQRKHSTERPYSCTQCNKSFKCRTSLASHQRRHSDERPFLCLQCGFRFKFKSALAMHEAKHAGKRGHCTVCNKTFNVSYLKRHMRTHTGEKPYKCSECDKSFASEATLANHKLRHTGERAHLCPVCGKAFARQDVLKTHQRVHTGEKPFQCGVCEEKFSYITTLQSHQKREHGIEPSHKCSQCGDSFKTAKELKSHECVQGGNKKRLDEEVEEAVKHL